MSERSKVEREARLASADNERRTESRAEARDGLQMPPEVMLDLARLTAELIVERIDGLPGENAWEGDFRQELENQLTEDPPENGRPAAEVLERAAREILPVAARNDHPRFFGFIPSSPTWPGVLADFMAAGYHVNQCTWLTSSGPSQLELVVIDWMRRWLGYPESAGGLFTSGGSAASVDAFVAAREAAGHPERATVYMSDQSHSAHIRAARIVGVRSDFIRMIPTDERFRLDMESLARAVADDRAAGFSPIAVCANAGAGEHRRHRSPRGDGGLLRDGRHLAARRRRVRRLRGRDRRGQETLARNRAGGFDRTGCAQVVLPTIRGRHPPGEGPAHPRACIRRQARCPPGHDMGRKSPELLGLRPATEPLGPGSEGLGVSSDLRNGRVPERRVQGNGARGSRR